MNDNYIEVKNLTKMIKGNVVLNNLNLELKKGNIYGFRGRNGSGKTMLFRAICGLIKPTEGYISIYGSRIGVDIAFPKSVGAIIEYPGFINEYTGFENLKFISKIKNVIKDEDIYNTLELVGLNPNDKRKFKKYSLGMKQRLGLAQAIMENPDLLVLDEPTNALDKEGVEEFKAIVNNFKQKGKTVLIASHDKEQLELLADEIFTIEFGKIIEHTILKEIK